MDSLGLCRTSIYPWLRRYKDEGLEALVIRLGKGLDQLQRNGDSWTVGAGLPAPLAARRTAEAGFAGLHIFVGVPGTVGGGVYMNAGCHGGDWSEVVERATVVDASGRDTVLERRQIPFTYRRSGLDGRIVLETTVRLRQEEPARLEEAVTEMFEWRQRGTPFNQPCCGSVFKNPAGPSWKKEEGPRTAGQLIEAATGAHLWADKIDGALNDVFELQDQVAQSVVGAILPRLLQAEMDIAGRKPRSTWNCYDKYLRGNALLFQFSPAAVAEAKEEYAQALSLDPNFAPALASLAGSYVIQRLFHGQDLSQSDLSKALELAARAAAAASTTSSSCSCSRSRIAAW
jgi:UDP-N-acetylenolpyruvoylglucosamine reductase